MDVLQREYWAGHPVDLGEGFRLHKHRGGHVFEAVCGLRTHPRGWELVLSVNENLQSREVCRSQEEILSRTESWKAALTIWNDRPAIVTS
jgi:hypothetical protein